MASNVIYLDQYINALLKKLFADNELCKLLYYDVTNVSDYPDLVDNSILYTDLFNRRIFPMTYTLENMESEKTMLFIDIVNAELDDSNVFYKDINIDITVLSHLRLWELDNDVNGDIRLRLNAIINRLNDILNRQRVIGLGTMLFDYLQKIYVDRNYSGYKISFRTLDFTPNG